MGHWGFIGFIRMTTIDIYLNTLFPAGGSVWEGYRRCGLDGEGGMSLWGTPRFQNSIPFPVSSLCLMPVDEDISPWYYTTAMPVCLLPCPCHDGHGK